jgi:RHS repeat-associated protein
LLNQITSRSVPGDVDVMGLSLATNTVSVNGTNAYQKWEYYREQMATNNTSAAQWVGITVTATNQTTVTGGAFVAQTPETFTYDLDGNLTQDGRWTYSWDGENRLISMTSLTGAPNASKYSVTNTYDYLGRRIQKVVWAYNISSYTNAYTNRYLYDGWNPVAILNTNSTLIASMMWGLDLSGSGQGAGGVGGLLEENVVGNGVHFVAYDGNGNVAALVSATNGTITANYEHGPFGEVIRATGPMAKLNPFRFSTKYQDDETDFLYYGFRYYNPSTGRWLSRDPIDDAAYQKLVLWSSFSRNRVIKLLRERNNPPYLFVHNDPVSKLDVLGLSTDYTWSIPPCGNGLYTATIQVGLGGSTFYKSPFVDDGSHGARSDKGGCPPLYPGTDPSAPGDGNLYEDQPGNTLGTVGLNGLKFEVCRVCLAPCSCIIPKKPHNSGPAALPGYKIVSVGPCRTFVIPGVGKSEDLDSTTDPSVTSSPTASGGFNSALTGSYPNALSGGCFQCNK